MDIQETERLKFPYIAAGQSQKHVTHNEFLDVLDALVFLAVDSEGSSTPPASPAEDERHLVGVSPTGAWAGRQGSVADFTAGTWRYHAPQAGWIAFNRASGTLRVHDGAAWRDAADRVATLGINTVANQVNRLSIASAASLFDHEGGSHRMTINRAASTQTASAVFQTAYSGRAEIGLTGGDAFQIKLSNNGAAWTNALAITADARFGANVDPGPSQFTLRGMDTSGAGFDLHVVKQDYWSANVFETASNNALHCGIAALRRSRGTLQAPTPVQAGDQIGAVAFRSRAPSGAFVQTGLINAWVSGAPAGGAVPTDLVFSCGDTGAQERMRINSAGNVGVGVNAPTVRLHVAGPVRIGSYVVASLPSAVAAGAGAMVYVSDAAGGAVTAFSDGANWRRTNDRTIVA